MLRRGTRFTLVLVCFALSGFAGLLYETVWARQFSFVFGTSGLAVSTVLAAYMGGLALGALLAGRRIDRVRRPVLVYGLLELGVALSALAVPTAIEASRWLHGRLLGGVADPGSPLALALYLSTSLLILALPTSLMGATLPLLARDAVETDPDVGPRVGALYAVNTFGAVFGTIATAFALAPALGLRGTVLVGVGVNGLVFLGAAWLSRGAWRSREGSVGRESPRAPTVAAAPPQATLEEAPLRASAAGPPRVLLVAGLAGVASFGYEVLWVRLLEHLLGGSLYAFAAMLASFLVGIALGGALAARRARDRSQALSGIAWTQAGVAGFSLLAYHALVALPGGLEIAGGSAGRASLGTLAGLCALILLPATLCIGAMFPLAVRALAADAGAAARSSANVYAANTLGAIAGSIATGFWLLPALGFEGTLLVAMSLGGLVAILAWTAERAGRRLALVPLAAVLALTFVWPPRTPWLLLRASPVRSALAARDDAEGVLFHAVGRSASVIAISTPEGIRIRTNGLPESLIPALGARSGLVPAARWMGAVPALGSPGAKRMLVIGLGGGVAVELVPPSIERIDVVELEPQVLAANRAIASQRRNDPASDPRLRIRVGDARSVLDLEREPYDAIVSQPSHPWTAGASHLYTREFFERVEGRLSPDGLFVQWLGLSYVDESLLRSFVATLCDVFPNVRLYRPSESSLLFVASRAPLALESRVASLARTSPALASRIGLRTPAELASALALDEDGARRFADAAPLITDDRNRMATRAPWVTAPLLGGIDALLAPYAPVPEASSGVDRWSLLQSLLERGRAGPAMRLAGRFERAEERRLAEVVVAARLGRGRPTPEDLAGLDACSPAGRERCWLLARALRAEIAAERPWAASFAAGFDGEAASVIEGWKRAAKGRWSELEALESRLAATAWEAPWWPDAHRLRIAWRVESGRRAALREALELLDLDPRWTPERLALRARVAAAIGERAIARASLFELAALAPAMRSETVAAQARWALRRLPQEALDSGERAFLSSRLAPSNAAAAPRAAASSSGLDGSARPVAE